MNFALISFSIAVSGKPPYLGNKFRSSAQAMLARRIRAALNRIWTSRVAILFVTFMPIILARSGLATRSICDTSKADTTGPYTSVIRLNPAIRDRVKSGHRERAEDVIVLPCRRVALQGGEWRVDAQIL